mmetsp:Transcript_150149/g.279990  ORF Transcript_150149/g.279990 Transcript_150149/m.279990 type:complete len:297 (+) Transcript_150149:99-989(+)
MAAGRALAVVLSSSALFLAAGDPPREEDAAALSGEATCRKSLVQKSYNIAPELQEGELDERYLPPRARYPEPQLLQAEREALSMSRNRQPSSSDWLESYSEMDAGRDSLPELDPHAPRPPAIESEREVSMFPGQNWAETDAEELSPELAEALKGEAMAAARLPDTPGQSWQPPRGSSPRAAKGIRSADLAASRPSQLHQDAAERHTIAGKPKAPVPESGIRPALISAAAMVDKVHDSFVRTPVASSLLAIRHKVLGSTVEVHREAMMQGMIVVSMSFVFITMVAGSVLFMAASGKR